jgi:SAM-dependent methyltransferase
MTPCLLCHSESTAIFYEGTSHLFCSCSHCGSVFRHPSNFISATDEKARYLTHNNDVNDPRYQDFVAPITERVIKDFKNGGFGLDFGAGTGPVITKILSENGYDLNLYDPYFHPDKNVLNETYDFIVCCEVIEHFNRPDKEFRLLKELLRPGGKLYCMTDLLCEREEFENWYYKDDPTHVIFYSEANLRWISEEMGFSEVEIEDRLIVFSK